MKNFKAKTIEDEEKKLVVFLGLCKGCGMCIEKCPQKAISFSPKDLGYYSTPSVDIDLKKCNKCGICELVCPDSAIRIKRKK